MAELFGSTPRETLSQDLIDYTVQGVLNINQLKVSSETPECDLAIDFPKINSESLVEWSANFGTSFRPE